ncbi:MAG: hypothetical protein Fur0046_32650 [Cyanobacteria bacterium J069]|nr:MAG: type II secretion system protein [Cyanobacteria bacterium J069]
MKVLTRLGAESLPTRFERCSVSGFTLVEKIAVMAILGTLMAIAAPGWLTFFTTRSLVAAQDTVFQTLRLAQSRAEQSRIPWQVSIRTAANGLVQVAAHSVDAPPDQIPWRELEPAIQLHPTEMTLYQSSGIYRVRFDHQGRVSGQLGRVTLIHNHNLQVKSCVTVSTLVGVVRKGCPAP